MSIKKIQFSPIKEQRRRDFPRTAAEEDEEEDDGSQDQELEEFTPNSDLTVKFQITETQIIAHSYPRSLSLKDIKRDIAGKFKVPDNALELRQSVDQQVIVNERIKLNDLPRNQFGIVELQLKLKEEEAKDDVESHSQRKTPSANAPLKLDLNVYYSNFTLPEIITVNVSSNHQDPSSSSSGDRKIIVEIDNRQIVKPFLGGYRDPVTKTEYHHASTQTGPMKVFHKPILTRETQTEAHLIKSLRTTRTPRNEIREFVSSDEMLVRLERLKSVKIIQRNFRAFKWRQLIKSSAEQWRTIQQKAREKMNYETVNADYNRVLRLLYMDPKEKEDFDQIHMAIQNWKREEKIRLKALHGGNNEGAYIAELNLVVEKEIFLLNEVEQRKAAVKAALKEKSSERLLRRLGKPKKFLSKSQNIVLEMDTITSQRTRFWTDFYNSLKSPPKDKQKRLELLDSVLESLDSESWYAKLKVLRELLERERSLWEMNFSSSDMETLRSRQLLLLFDLIQSISQHAPSSDDPQQRIIKRICGKCKNLLPESRLVLLGRKDIPDICKQCDSLHRSVHNKDDNVYREILRCIRRDERKCGALASFAFIIQEQDIEYLVETVWHGHSILSQTTDRHRLRLPRYVQSEDWSPWNCILLTETEAKAHLKLGSSCSAVYQPHLLQLIASRNNLALTAFRRLNSINYEFVESGQWWSDPPVEASN